MRQAQEKAQQLMCEGTEVNQEEYRRLQREIVFAQNELQEYENELAHTENSLARIGDSISGVGGKITGMGNALMPVTTVITGLGAAAVKTAADFDSSMSQVQATMGITKDAIAEVDGQTVNTMDTLSALSKKMGAETAFSASECAEALNIWHWQDMIHRKCVILCQQSLILQRQEVLILHLRQIWLQMQCLRLEWKHQKRH